MLSNPQYGPDYSWMMVGDRQLYWEKHGMANGEYLFEKNRLVELYKEKKISLREMLYRWKRDAKPHKESLKVCMGLLERLFN